MWNNLQLDLPFPHLPVIITTGDGVGTTIPWSNILEGDGALPNLESLSDLPSLAGAQGVFDIIGQRGLGRDSE